MSEQPSTVWVGGRVLFSSSLAGLAPSESLLTLWVELPSLLVVGQLLEDPSAPETTFAQALERAIEAPLAGAPRRPTQVRVASEALAAELRALALPVEVAPTPELDVIVRSLDAFVGKGSYYSDPLLTLADLTELFDAVAQLWPHRPWELVEDNALLYVESEALAVSDSALSILGSSGEVPALVLLPSYEDFELLRDAAAADEADDFSVSHSALYLALSPGDDVAPALRDEVQAAGWPLPEPGRYPVLRRVHEGKPAPVLQRHVRTLTAIARALSQFVPAHRDALEQYGELPVHETYEDAAGIDVELTVPHPEVDLSEFEEPPRADTLAGGDNPYDLELSREELALLTSGLNKLSLHRFLGILVGVASAPHLLPPPQWMQLLTAPPKAASDAELSTVIGLMMQVYNQVIARMGAWEIDGLIPVAADAHACREWARGFVSVCDEVGLGEQRGEAIDNLFALYVLAERPAYLKVLEDHLGDGSRADRIAQFRDVLADAVSFLYDHWEKDRRAAAQDAAAKPEPVRAGPKTGRNDPCPCGSGKKFKKCHG